MFKSLKLKTLMLLLAVIAGGSMTAWADAYRKVTTGAELTDGQYLIVYEEGNLALNGGLTDKLDAVGNTIEVTISDGEIASDNTTDAASFTYDATSKTLLGAGGLYMGQTSDANGLQSSATTTYENEISIDEDGNANIVSGGAYLRYNNAANQTRFRYYKSATYAGQKAIQLYKKTADSNKKAAGLSYETTSFEINLGDAFTAPALNNPNQLPVTYSSSSEEVATVNAVGAVTIVAAGTTTITASFAGNDEFFAGSASYKLTVVDANAPGTSQDNPYTVAQARAAIDAGTGVEGVYAKGIVSKIVNAYNSKYGNISYNISEDGTESADQLQAYRGFDAGGEKFTSADDVQVGDEVIIYGDLKKFNSTYEFDANNQRVWFNRPTVAVEKPEFSVVAGAYEPTNVEISCATDGATIRYTTDGSDPKTSGAVYEDPIRVDQTMTIRAIAQKNSDWSIESTATYVIVDAGNNSADEPFTVAEAKEFIDGLMGYESPMDVYVSGTVSQVDSYANGNITYWISDDGTTGNQMEVYRGYGLNGDQFTAKDDLNVGDKVVVCGKVVLYNSKTYEFSQNSKLVSLKQGGAASITVETTSVSLSYEEQEGTIEVTLKNVEEAEVQYLDADGSVLPGGYDWLAATLGDESITYIVEENTGKERTAYLRVYGIDADAEDVYSEVITITQKVPVKDYAELPFTFDGKKADIEGTNGLTQNGLGNDYSASPHLSFRNTGASLVLKINEEPGTLSFDMKANPSSGGWQGIFTVLASVDGEEYTTVATYEEITPNTVFPTYVYNLPASTRYIKWEYTEKVQGNIALGNIKLTEAGEVRFYVNEEAGYATVVTPEDVTFDNGEAYVVTSATASSVKIEAIEQAPANTPVILKSEAGEVTAQVNAPTHATERPAVNLLKASDGNVSGGATIYALANLSEGVGFYNVGESVTIPAGKAYLEIDGATAAAGARAFLAIGGEETTGINTMEQAQKLGGEVFDLQGRRVSQPTKGLYIVNGQKVVVK